MLSRQSTSAFIDRALKEQGVSKLPFPTFNPQKIANAPLKNISGDVSVAKPRKQDRSCTP